MFLAFWVDMLFEPEVTPNKTFNFALNIYVPLGMFDTNNVLDWLCLCGCSIEVTSSELVIYDRSTRIYVDKPENLLNWLIEQYSLNNVH